MESLKSVILFSFLLASATLLFAQKGETVKMWEEKMTLLTYKTGVPDKNPIFYIPDEYQGA